ncbi:MAG TPA: hypothetical protein VN377_05115 [Candidatus Thermoplasmatota archaeon]|nr:hypothetical protein [Candidatus Thermoplasmatota archaeon]
MNLNKKIILRTGCIVILLLMMNLFSATGQQLHTRSDTFEPTLKNQTSPMIIIVKPKPGSLYIQDKQVARLPLGRIQIIGKLTMVLEAADNSSEIMSIDIYVDNIFKVRLQGPYYEWMLDDPLFFRHKIRIVTYDVYGTNVSTEFNINIWCLGRLPEEPSTPKVGTANQNNTDGYNYQRNKNGVGDFVYNQLWYFNFLDDRGTSDTSDDIAGVAAYGLANPENKLTGGGLTNTFGMIIRNSSEGTSFPLFSDNYDPTNPSNFSASPTFEPGPGPELQNPSGTIDVISPDHYHITGQVIKDSKEITWDLHYRRSLGQPWLPWVHWPVPKTLGIIPAWITYHMQMANAVVNGIYTVKDGANQTTYNLVDAKGYHDGFYSEFVFSIFEWNWIDFKQDNLSVHLLYPHAPVYSCEEGWETCTPGNLRVVTNTTGEQKEYNFYRGCDLAKNEINVQYGNLATDPRYPDVKYPTQATITAEDDSGNKLIVQWSLLRYMIVYFDVPDPFYDTVTFEIIANFTGTFYEADTGMTVPIAGTGWSDWSGEAFPQQ